MTPSPYSANLGRSWKRARCREPNAPCALLLAAICLVIGGCAHRVATVQSPSQTPLPSSASGPFPSPPSGPPPAIERQPVVPGEYAEQGVASWYGAPFDGRRTSDGEVYDMHDMTAAHRTLPFGALVRVTNLLNGKQTDVRINDRGPFVANRVIDLSYAAAQALQMIGTGTAPVRIEVVSAPGLQAGFFGVQVGAFRAKENADRLKTQLAAHYSSVSIAASDSPNGTLYRVRVGRLPTEDAARQLAAELHSSGQSIAFVVRLDE